MRTVGTAEMAQAEKLLPRKSEVADFDPQHPDKRLGLEKWRQVDLWS